MDDSFLHTSRPPVRPGFAESLYVRITRPPQQRTNRGRCLRVAWQAVLASLLGVTSLLTLSQPVRAGVLDWIRTIAGLEVQETDTVRMMGDDIAHPPPVQSPVQDALRNAPFEFLLPTHIPGGFSLEDSVDIYDESVFMRWLNHAGDEILMQVETDHGQRYLMGVNAAQEIQINNRPALLAQGGYDPTGNWDAALPMINIIQRRDELVYWLIYVGKPGAELDADAIRDQLTRMMGSIP